MPSLPGLCVVSLPNPGFRCAPPWATVLRPSRALLEANAVAHEEARSLGVLRQVAWWKIAFQVVIRSALSHT
jgi:hypothetical protein